MKIGLLFPALVFVAVAGMTSAQYSKVLPAPNGITIPDNYRDWSIIAPSHRSDNNTIRVVLGNDIAVKAARAGKSNPWPDGTVLAKIVWKIRVHEKWPTANIPGDLVHAEFMIKDSQKHASTGGWGFARWIGMEQKPYGKDSDFVMECFGCHIPFKENDYVFTHPAIIP